MQQSSKDGSAVGGVARLKLATTLETVFSEAVYDHSALQSDICGYVRELKASGSSAQAVVIAARTLVRDAAGNFPHTDRTETLLTRMLGWCLDEYYKESA
jgi:hypothetical protein